MKTKRTDTDQTVFWCPGCEEHHVINDTWQISGTPDSPTFSPSVLVTSGHYAPGFVPGSDCWCTYNEKHPGEPSHFICKHCHSFVRDGKIEYLSDSTHAFAGTTVEMIDLEEVR